MWVVRFKNKSSMYFGSFRLTIINQSCNSGNVFFSCLKIFFLISGLPVRLSNLTFIWKAPNRNVGSIRAVASVANKNIYQKLMSREIRHETFPVSYLLFFPCKNSWKTHMGFGHYESFKNHILDQHDLDFQCLFFFGLDHMVFKSIKKKKIYFSP